MPNWCNNELYIKYRKLTKEQIEQIKYKFCRKVEVSDFKGKKTMVDMFDFNKFIPTPRDLYSNPDSSIIGWRINNWGVKWNACSTSIDEKGVFFDTAWGPVSEELLKAICEKLKEVLDEKQMKNLIYRYEEPGNCVKGRIDIGEDIVYD